MAKWLVGLIISLLFIGAGFVHYYNRNYIYPNTYLASLNISQKSQSDLLKLLAKKSQKRLKIKVEKRIYQYALADLGIIFDLNKTYEQIVAENYQSFPQNWRALVKSFWSHKMVLPQLVFTEDYYQKIDQQIFDFSQTPDQLVIDHKNKQVISQSNQVLFQIDPNSLKKEIVLNFGENTVLKPQVQRVIEDKKLKLRANQYNKQLKLITTTPVYILYGDQGTAAHKLSQKQLEDLLEIDYNNSTETLSVNLNKSSFNMLYAQLTGLIHSGDLQFNKQELKDSLRSLIQTRFSNLESNYVYAKLIEKPNTQGKQAIKYIEIDLSQQKMYLWDQGQNIATHLISSGLYYPTPPGQYKVLNKAPNAYSFIYNVWMPYWMAFSLDPVVNAYLGIHELPYWVDAGGEAIRRPQEFLGAPHTGGCVSLDVGVAEVVYSWADIGTPVLVYE